MRILRLVIIIFFISTLPSCFGFTTNNPDKAFMYWNSIQRTNTEVNVLHGRYWESSHFTFEFEAVFKMIASKEWINQLIELNSLEPSSKGYEPSLLNDIKLDWFSPTSDYELYAVKDGYPNLRLWIHPTSDTI